MSNSQEKISVALCTYNGEPFLRQQLASIQQQTSLPDELVVCDDQSTDQTLTIVRQFAASAPYPVKIFENERNLGFAANFERAIRLCEGDLIALSDQDDIWYPNRLERSAQELTAHPEAGLVFSDADVINDSDEVAGPTLWQRLGFAGKHEGELLAGQYTVLAKHRFVTGATVMFRAGLRDHFLPIGTGWIHDEWIALIAAAFSDLRPISQPLIRYRVHGSQQVGFRNKLEQRALLVRKSIGAGWQSRSKISSRYAMHCRQWHLMRGGRFWPPTRSTCSFLPSGLTFPLRGSPASARF
jgi:glycosyltransferase involved in cell wall biosynthesis